MSWDLFTSAEAARNEAARRGAEYTVSAVNAAMRGAVCGCRVQGDGAAEAAVPEADTLRTRLEEIVARLEEEALELGESLALFEEGVRPLRVTQGILDRTEARVQQLLQDGEGFRLDDWEEP